MEDGEGRRASRGAPSSSAAENHNANSKLGGGVRLDREAYDVGNGTLASGRIGRGGWRGWAGGVRPHRQQMECAEQGSRNRF